MYTCVWYAVLYYVIHLPTWDSSLFLFNMKSHFVILLLMIMCLVLPAWYVINSKVHRCMLAGSLNELIYCDVTTLEH